MEVNVRSGSTVRCEFDSRANDCLLSRTVSYGHGQRSGGATGECGNLLHVTVVSLHARTDDTKEP